VDSLTDNHQPQESVKTEPEGVDMAGLCRTIIRVLVILDEAKYTGHKQQDTVRQHDALPDPASDCGTREAS
jgi:hypothetical protein